MCKKLILLAVVALSFFTLPAQAFWQDDAITMLVMPREAIPLQIAQDISRRYPVIIVSYQMVRGDLKLHAWNGDNWVFVSVPDYTNGTFFANRPKHAIVVENERLRAPAVLTPNSTWCATANRITSTDPRALIHLLGIHFDFPYRYWDQFAKRYGYPLEQINPTMQNVHWWNLRYDVLREKRAQRDSSVDIDKWYLLETLPPPAVVPVVTETKAPAPAPVAPVKTAASATAVAITAKASEVPVEKAPAVIPVPVQVIEPVKAAEPAPVEKPAPAVEVFKQAEPAPAEKPAPVTEPVIKPAEPAVPAPIAELAPIVQPVATTEETSTPTVVAEKATETPAPAPTAEPAAMTEIDPFSADEIPAAEIVVPQEPKKRWWNIF